MRAFDSVVGGILILLGLAVQGVAWCVRMVGRGIYTMGRVIETTGNNLAEDFR